MLYWHAVLGYLSFCVVARQIAIYSTTLLLQFSIYFPRRRIYVANKLSRLRNAHTCGKESTRATFTKIESRHTKIEEMDTRINLSQVPFFLDENCILMCVHKDERKSRPSCLFVFSSCPPFHSRCNLGARISSRNIFGWQPLMSTNS